LRQTHIVLEQPLYPKGSDIPYAVLGYFSIPEYLSFNQNIEKAIGRYDHKEKDVHRIDFSDFCPKVLERNKEKNDQESKPKSMLKCQNRGKEWVPKTQHPLSCPKCRHYFGYEVVNS